VGTVCLVGCCCCWEHSLAVLTLSLVVVVCCCDATLHCSVWNPLFLRTDAAVKALAAEYGVREGEILDRESDNLATRAVLVETHVIKQTKEFLEQVRALAAWLLGCLAAWLLGCLAAWLLGCLFAWLLDCLAAWLVVRWFLLGFVVEVLPSRHCPLSVPGLLIPAPPP
jgi:hypothetical protein